MSTKVLNPFVNELYKIRSPIVRRHIPNVRAVEKVKRDLFGFGPIDKEDTKRFVDKELAKHHLAACKRWGFDFAKGYPITDNKQYVWERVPPTYPLTEMYTLSRAAHVHSSSSSSSSSSSESSYLNQLLDERAERSNRTTEVMMSSCDEFTADEDDKSIVCNISQSSIVSSPEMVLGNCSKKRQPKITDYLKERKRLAPTPKKATPPKRTRSSAGSSSSTITGMHTLFTARR